LYPEDGGDTFLRNVGSHNPRVRNQREQVAAVTSPVHAGSSLADFSTLKMEEIRSSETSVHTRLHSATSQKTAFFIVTAVKTSNF
jgi:hypothetical protein